MKETEEQARLVQLVGRPSRYWPAGMPCEPTCLQGEIMIAERIRKRTVQQAGKAAVIFTGREISSCAGGGVPTLKGSDAMIPRIDLRQSRRAAAGATRQAIAGQGGPVA